MQVVVKEPRIRLEGEITQTLVDYLRKEFAEVVVIDDDSEALVEVIESDWYRSIRAEITPGENMRIYREMHGMTQAELGRKLGQFARQNISNMEHGHRQISKAVARKLAELFQVSVEKFI